MTKRIMAPQFSLRILRGAMLLTARKFMSVRLWLTKQVELQFGEDKAYLQAQRKALTLLEAGFHMGGEHLGTREELHERW